MMKNRNYIAIAPLLQTERTVFEQGKYQKHNDNTVSKCSYMYTRLAIAFDAQ